MGAPIGYIDPLNLVEDGNQEKFDRLRYIEIKHGRISMLAVLGYLVTEAGIRLPGGFDAIDAIPVLGRYQLFFLIGFLETYVMVENVKGEFPGDLRNGGDVGFNKWDAETQFRKRGIELNNGRAAMMGILGLMVHEKLGVSLLPEGAVH